MPVKAMVLVKKEAPARMNMIMHDSRVAPIRLSKKFFQVSDPPQAASINAPTTPNMAASVAVA